MNGLTKNDYEEIGSLIDEKLDKRFKGYPTGAAINKLMINIDKMMLLMTRKEEADVVHQVRHESSEDDLVNLKQRMLAVEKTLGIRQQSIGNYLL